MRHLANPICIISHKTDVVNALPPRPNHFIMRSTVYFQITTQYVILQAIIMLSAWVYLEVDFHVQIPEIFYVQVTFFRLRPWLFER